MTITREFHEKNAQTFFTVSLAASVSRGKTEDTVREIFYLSCRPDAPEHRYTAGTRTAKMHFFSVKRRKNLAQCNQSVIVLFKS